MHDNQFDLVVVGVGTVGSMALWHAARRGARVLGIERYGIGHQRGAAGGETRIFRTAYKEGRQYVPLLERSSQLWAELQDTTGHQVFLPTGALTLGPADHPEVTEVLASGRSHGLPLEVLDSEEAAHRFPQHRLGADDIAVLDPAGGLLRPSVAIGAAVDAARAHGATVCTDTVVEDLVPTGTGVRVVLADREVIARRVIATVGPWSRQLFPEIAPLMEVRRSVLHWFAPRAPERYSPDRFPVGIRRGEPGRNLSFFPCVDGETIKVNWHIPKSVVPDPEDFDGAIDADYSSRVAAGILPLFDGLEPQPRRAAGYMEGYTPDNHGLIGELPDRPGVWVFAGFSGHGFKMSPVLGDIAASLALEGGSQHDVAFLDLARTATPDQRSTNAGGADA